MFIKIKFLKDKLLELIKKENPNSKIIKKIEYFD